MFQAVSSHCYALSFSRAADRPALGAICGTRFTLRVDAGNSPAHSALMDQTMAQFGLPRAHWIALTHSHWDHSYGLARDPRPAIACRETQRHLQAMTQWSWTMEAMERRLVTGEDIRFCHDYLLEEYPDPSAIEVRGADIVFDRQLTLDLGGVEAQLLFLPNSHADDCVVVYVPQDGVVYLGDIAYEDLHHTPPCIHRKRFTALRRALEALDFTLAVPGHQETMSKEALLRDMEETLSESECVLDD